MRRARIHRVVAASVLVNVRSGRAEQLDRHRYESVISPIGVPPNCAAAYGPGAPIKSASYEPTGVLVEI